MNYNYYSYNTILITFASTSLPNFSNVSFNFLSDVDHARPPMKQRYSSESDILNCINAGRQALVHNVRINYAR